ncbi:MAG: PPC domain-containing DNA-binding protein [Candidatus Hadarchaeaceae archaeon]
MKSSRYRVGRAFLCRAEHKSELIESILDFVEEKKIKMAVFSVIGAVDDAILAYYDHEKKKYKKIILNRPLEIASSFGNISLKGGQPFAHLHVVFSDVKGKTYAGHLISATVFAAEIHFLELVGKKLEREPDQITGLALWRFGK